MSALSKQEGGSHYKDCAIQPVEYIYANSIGYMEGNVIKYVTRWKNKNGIADLRKARHYIDLLIELEERGQPGEVIQQHDAAAPEQDMSDWRSWQVGDLIERVSDESRIIYTAGRLYPVLRINEKGLPVVQDDTSKTAGCYVDDEYLHRWRWHSRPSAAAQPVAAGDDGGGIEH